MVGELDFPSGPWPSTMLPMLIGRLMSVKWLSRTTCWRQCAAIAVDDHGAPMASGFCALVYHFDGLWTVTRQRSWWWFSTNPRHGASMPEVPQANGFMQWIYHGHGGVMDDSAGWLPHRPRWVRS